MKKVFCLLTLCVLLFSCIKEEPDPNPIFDRTNYTLNITAVKGERPDTKALSFDGLQLKASWAVGEKVNVFLGNVALGTLEAKEAGETTTLSGTVTKAPKVGDELRLEFLSPDYDKQEGSLDYIATHCDYATASVTVSAMDESTITTTTACFRTWQAVVAFRLVDAENPSQSLSASSLAVTMADRTITVTPETPASEFFVAVPAVPDQPVSLQASVGDKPYSLYKHGIELEAAVYYVITAKLSPSVIVHNESELKAAVQSNQARILFANDITIGSFVQITGSKAVNIDLCGFTLDRGCRARGSQVVIVENDGTLNLMNGTLTGGWGGDGGGLLNKGTSNLTDVTVRGNAADNRCGGISNQSGATLTITGGYVYAKGGWEYGAGIGGGDGIDGGNVTITGGTVIARAGLDETGCRAIGPGEGCDDYGSLTLGDNMMVSSERMANVDERKNMCWYRTRVRVEPCTHPGHTADDCPYHKHGQ